MRVWWRGWPRLQGRGAARAAASTRSSSTPTPRRSTRRSRQEDGLQEPASRWSTCWAACCRAEDGQELTPRKSPSWWRARRRPTRRPAGCGRASSGSAGPRPAKCSAERSAEAASEMPPAQHVGAAPNPCSKAEDAIDDLEGREVRVVKAQRGDTLARILLRLGAETWQARAMTDAARSALPRRCAAAGPGGAGHAGALGDARQRDGADSLQRVRRGPGPQGHRHAQRRRRVRRQRLADRRAHRAAPRSTTTTSRRPSSLYASLHYTAERQGIPPELILQILKIHAYETDFRQRVRAGDGFEFFFDMKEDDKGIEGEPGRAAGDLRHVERRDAQVLPLPHARRGGRLLRRAGQHLAQVPDAAPGARRGRAHHLGLRRAPPSDPADPARCTPASTGPAPRARRSWRRATA